MSTSTKMHYSASLKIVLNFYESERKKNLPLLSAIPVSLLCFYMTAFQLNSKRETKENKECLFRAFFNRADASL